MKIIIQLISISLLIYIAQSACFYRCNTCVSGNDNECKFCYTTANRFTLEEDKTCKCHENYYHTAGTRICAQCPSNCLDCNDQITAGDKVECVKCAKLRKDKVPICDECVDNAYEAGNICYCNSGFKENNDSTACIDKGCALKCGDCQDSDINDCIDCRSDDSDTNRFNKNHTNKCDCKPGYYDDKDNGPNCQKCNDKCSSCQTNKDKCTGCSDNLAKLNANSDTLTCTECVDNAEKVSTSCQCKDNFYEKSNACHSCGDKCVTCDKSSGCTQCQKFYYPSNQTCAKCGDNCEECTNATTCTKCSKKFYVDGGSCKPCDSKCGDCETTADNCTECIDPNKIAKACTVCKDTYYDPKNGSNCQKCNYPCLNCSDSNTCTSCQEPTKRNNDSKCTCADGYFANGNQCDACTYPCLTCQTNSTTCKSCKTTENRISTTDCRCEDTYFDNGSKCEQCDSTRCKLCKNKANECTQCIDYRTNLNSCNDCITGASKNVSGVCLCDSDHYSITNNGVKECPKCQVKCATCHDDTGKCKTCASDRNSDSPDCTCKSGTYDPGNNTGCKSCEYPCQTCSTRTSCLTCKTTLNRKSGSNPSCSCEDGYFDNGSNCEKCGKYCATCVDNAQKCLTCAEYREYAPNCHYCVRGTQNHNDECLFDTVITYDPMGTEKEKLSRCMSDISINKKENCQMCRADKNSQGRIISQVGEGSGSVGTYTLRKILGIFKCTQDSNESGTIEEYDQEERVPFCEMYDEYGLCVRCLVRYGLQWQYTEDNKDGKYTCVPNENRVPFCHEYNSSDKCIKCKWNQNDDEKELYSSVKQEYQLDYGLFVKSGKTYCVNNMQYDMIIRKVDDKFLDSHRRSNCAEYNSEYKCVKCHSRKFDHEGNVQWEQYNSKTGSFYESLDYIIDDIDGGSCISYPHNYITKPELLKKVDTNLNSIQSTSKCIESNTLYKQLGETSYGCGPTIQNCIEADFNWDYEGFQSTGLWHKIFLKCTQCSGSFITDGQGQKCIEASNNLQNCSKTDTNNQCLFCKSGYSPVVLQTDQTTECVSNGKLPGATAITNCIDYYYYKTKDNIIKRICKICDFGYLPTYDGKCSYHTDYNRRGCVTKDKDSEYQCQSSSQYGWKESDGTCENGIVRNVEQLCYTTSPIKTITNCSIYINTENTSKCHKCKEGYLLNESQDLCLIESSEESGEEGIEYCTVMDGPWCQKCQRNIKSDDGKSEINYILTNQNTCVKNNFIGNNQNCIYALYNDNTYGRSLSTCLKCDTCYQLDVSGICQQDAQCQQDSDKNIYTLSSLTQKVKGVEVKNCYIHKDVDGNCFQCDRVNNINYGIYLNTQNNKKECQECDKNQILQRSISGEYICVQRVEGCYQYSDKGYCVACDTYLQISDDKKSIQCVQTCNIDRQVLEFNSQNKMCLTAAKDSACYSTIDVSMQYEFFLNRNGNLQERCARCDSDYFVDADNGYNCVSKSTFTNYDTNFQYSRVIKGLRTSTPSVEVNNDKYMNNPCKSRYTTDQTHDYIYDVNLKYCIDYEPINNVNKNIKNCKFEGTNGTSSERICNECHPGFRLSSNQKQCDNESARPFYTRTGFDDQCLYQESSSSNCQYCSYGYVKGTYGCVKNTSLGCIDQGTNSCSVCQYPFIRVLKNSSTYYKCELIIDSCLKQTKEGYCDECQPGYQYDSGSKQCLRRTQNCYDQDFSISYDSKETKTMRGDVCKGCYQSSDKIRLMYYHSKEGFTKKLIKTCVYGCNQLKRQMSMRSPNNPFNIWDCHSCRNQEYHINTEFNSNWCVKADRITNCQLFEQKVNNFQEKCIACASGYYINKQGLECSSCTLTDNCQLQDEQATSLVDGKCKCKKCNDNFFLTASGSCKQSTETIENCKTYNSENKCIECVEQGNVRFLNKDGKCESYSADLNCGSSYRDQYSNTCKSCDPKSEFNLLTSDSKCAKGQIENCYKYIDAKTCDECVDGYGLYFDKSGCISNTDSKRQKNCKRYTEQELDGYPVCLECKRGYAFDYNFHDFKNEQCVNIDYCEKGYKDSTGTYCKECKVLDYANGDASLTIKRIYRKDPPYVHKSTCGVQNKADLNEVAYCKYYKTFTVDSKQCWQCHEGYSSDWDNDSKGIHCVSDEHPGSLPGCRFYEIFKDGDKYQKYEDLICRECESAWRYSKETELYKFSKNTYSYSCDQLGDQALTLPKENKWTGKDGGLRIKSENENGNNNDKPLPDSSYREFYEDPITFSQILQFSIFSFALIVLF